MLTRAWRWSRYQCPAVEVDLHFYVDQLAMVSSCNPNLWGCGGMTVHRYLMQPFPWCAYNFKVSRFPVGTYLSFADFLLLILRRYSRAFSVFRLEDWSEAASAVRRRAMTSSKLIDSPLSSSFHCSASQIFCVSMWDVAHLCLRWTRTFERYPKRHIAGRQEPRWVSGEWTFDARCGNSSGVGFSSQVCCAITIR